MQPIKLEESSGVSSIKDLSIWRSLSVSFEFLSPSTLFTICLLLRKQAKALKPPNDPKQFDTMLGLKNEATSLCRKISLNDALRNRPDRPKEALRILFLLFHLLAMFFRRFLQGLHPRYLVSSWNGIHNMACSTYLKVA
jgi:hypothetical protein